MGRHNAIVGQKPEKGIGKRYNTIDLSSAQANGYIGEQRQLKKSESTKCNEIQYLRNQKNLPSNYGLPMARTNPTFDFDLTDTSLSAGGSTQLKSTLATSGSHKLDAQMWALHTSGILSAINYDTREAWDFFPGSQPIATENFSHICTPMRKSVIGASPNGTVCKFKNGKFYELFKAKCNDPCFIDQLPSFYTNKLYMHHKWMKMR